MVIGVWRLASLVCGGILMLSSWDGTPKLSPAQLHRSPLLVALLPGTLEQRAILWVLSLFPPSSLIYFVIDFGGLMRRLSSGRAGDKMTGSQGLSALCSGFYLPDFMRLEPWLPLSWRNVKMILNHRV